MAPTQRSRDPVTGRILPRADETARAAEIERQLSGGAAEDYQPDSIVPRQRQPFVRKPFGNFDQKLAYPSRDGFHRHWFNDEPGRILQARDAGYEQVHDPNGRPVSTVVGIGRGGQALVAFLMELPQHLFEEDMAAQESAVHELMTQIGRGEHAKPGGADGSLRYPGSERGNIKIESGSGRR